MADNATIADPIQEPRTRLRLRAIAVLVAAIAAAVIGIRIATRPTPLDVAIREAGAFAEWEPASPRTTWDRLLWTIRKLTNRGSNRGAEYCNLFCDTGGIDDDWIAEHLSQLRSEKRLHITLSNSRLTKRGVAALASCPGLMGLSIDGGFDRECLEALLPARELTSLHVPDSALRDADLALLQEFPRLAYLGIDGRLLTAEGAEHLRNLPALTSLSLTNAGDEEVRRLSAFSQLTGIGLYGPAVTDASLPVLLSLAKPTTFSLTGTAITDDGLGQLRNQFPSAAVLSGTFAELEQRRDAWKQELRRSMP